MESTSGQKKKRISPSSMSQIQILSVLSHAPGNVTEPRKLQITEIAERSGLKDEKETQRFLFILEGQKLVSPFPAGDFTSKVWTITNQGMQTLKQISSSMTN
jgi:hypothetical protein